MMMSLLRILRGILHLCMRVSSQLLGISYCVCSTE